MNSRGIPRPINPPKQNMAKSNEQLVEVVHSHRSHLRHIDSRPQKAQKHRYERRKVREMIRLSDWGDEQSEA